MVLINSVKHTGGMSSNSFQIVHSSWCCESIEVTLIESSCIEIIKYSSYGLRPDFEFLNNF